LIINFFYVRSFRFLELEQEQHKDKGEDGDAAVEEAGRMLDFAVGWVAAFPEDFKSDHPVIERMADQARRWQEAMRERGDVKQGVRAGRLVLRLEAAKVPSMSYAGGGDRMQSLLMRAGSHLRNVAAAQASTGRRRSLRVLIGQQAMHSTTVSLQQSASATPIQASRLAQQQPQILPADLSQSGPLTRACLLNVPHTRLADEFLMCVSCALCAQRDRASPGWTSWRLTRARSRGSSR
jgi:hypothetical protein